MVMITCDAAKQRKDFWEKSQERSNNQKWKRLKSQKQNESSWEINEPASFSIYYEGKKTNRSSSWLNVYSQIAEKQKQTKK